MVSQDHLEMPSFDAKIAVNRPRAPMCSAKVCALPACQNTTCCVGFCFFGDSRAESLVTYLRQCISRFHVGLVQELPQKTTIRLRSRRNRLTQGIGVMAWHVWLKIITYR